MQFKKSVLSEVGFEPTPPSRDQNTQLLGSEQLLTRCWDLGVPITSHQAAPITSLLPSILFKCSPYRVAFLEVGSSQVWC